MTERYLMACKQCNLLQPRGRLICRVCGNDTMYAVDVDPDRTGNEHSTFTGNQEELKGQTMVDTEDTPRRVEVVWWDAWGDHGGYLQEAIKHMPPALRKSIGYLIDEDETTITLTGDLIDISFTGEKRVDWIRVIYKGMIERMVDL